MHEFCQALYISASRRAHDFRPHAEWRSTSIPVHSIAVLLAIAYPLSHHLVEGGCLVQGGCHSPIGVMGDLGRVQQSRGQAQLAGALPCIRERPSEAWAAWALCRSAGHCVCCL